MSKQAVRSFSREFKLRAVQRMEAGENVSALARELSVKRVMLYRWRDARRLGGVEALRLKGRPSKAEALAMAAARGVAGKANNLAEARWQIDQQQLDLDFFRQALRHFEASRPPSDRPGATASSPRSRR